MWLNTNINDKTEKPLLVDSCCHNGVIIIMELDTYNQCFTFQVLNRSTEPASQPSKSGGGGGGGGALQAPLLPCIPPVPPMAVIPQQLITAGTRKDCIRLRGLPYEAQVEHILEFLGDHAKNIVYQGVHMVFNAQVLFLTKLVTLSSCRANQVGRHSSRWTEKVQLLEPPTTDTTGTWSLGRSSGT